MKVTKAVILAAGLGTRMLPATKAIPKELFPIVDKPALQYTVEEMVASGITDILVVISRGKTLIEDHFDASPELEDRLRAGGEKKAAILKEVEKISKLANILYVRQPVMNGTGGAMLMAQAFTGNDPFLLAYGDDVIINDEYPVPKQCIDAYDEFGKGIIAVNEVSEDLIQKYSTMDVKPIRDNLYTVSDMIEKPTKEQIISLFSSLGRFVVPGNIYDYIARTKVAANGELQLTDSMKLMANEEGMIAVDFIGTRYDMGNKLGVMKAQVEMALKHPEIGAEFRTYLKEFAKEL